MAEVNDELYAKANDLQLQLAMAQRTLSSWPGLNSIIRSRGSGLTIIGKSGSGAVVTTAGEALVIVAALRRLRRLRQF